MSLQRLCLASSVLLRLLLSIPVQPFIDRPPLPRSKGRLLEGDEDSLLRFFEVAEKQGLLRETIEGLPDTVRVVAIELLSKAKQSQKMVSMSPPPPQINLNVNGSPSSSEAIVDANNGQPYVSQAQQTFQPPPPPDQPLPTSQSLTSAPATLNSPKESSITSSQKPTSYKLEVIDADVVDLPVAQQSNRAKNSPTSPTASSQKTTTQLESHPPLPSPQPKPNPSSPKSQSPPSSNELSQEELADAYFAYFLSPT